MVVVCLPASAFGEATNNSRVFWLMMLWAGRCFRSWHIQEPLFQVVEKQTKNLMAPCPGSIRHNKPDNPHNFIHLYKYELCDHGLFPVSIHPYQTTLHQTINIRLIWFEKWWWCGCHYLVNPEKGLKGTGDRVEQLFNPSTYKQIVCLFMRPTLLPIKSRESSAGRIISTVSCQTGYTSSINRK